MKTKFALAAAALVLTFGAFAPASAQAGGHYRDGYYVTKIVGYDRCGRPVYRQVWVPVCRPRPVCPPPVCAPRPICPPRGGIHIELGHHWGSRRHYR